MPLYGSQIEAEVLVVLHYLKSHKTLPEPVGVRMLEKPEASNFMPFFLVVSKIYETYRGILSSFSVFNKQKMIANFLGG